MGKAEVVGKGPKKGTAVESWRNQQIFWCHCMTEDMKFGNKSDQYFYIKITDIL